MALVVTLVVATVSAHIQPRLSRAFNFDGSIRGDSAIVAVAPDPRVRWESFPVDGLALCKPDSCIILPPGATLWIPFPVTDSTRSPGDS